MSQKTFEGSSKFSDPEKSVVWSVKEAYVLLYASLEERNSVGKSVNILRVQINAVLKVKLNQSDRIINYREVISGQTF